MSAQLTCLGQLPKQNPACAINAMMVFRLFPSMNKVHFRIVAIFTAMMLGVLVPALGDLSWAVQYLLVSMLFFSFFQISVKNFSLPKQVIFIAVANILLPILLFASIKPFNAELAATAFLTAIAPTAISATVITSMLKRNLLFVSASVLVTNLLVAVVLPAVLPLVLYEAKPISTSEAFFAVLGTILIPFVLAQIGNKLPLNTRQSILNAGKSNFWLWLVTLAIVVAKSVQFIHSQPMVNLPRLLLIAATSLMVCVMNFSIGSFLGGKTYYAEASQSLGQKNNTFVVWVALTFFNPIVALGPTFYILYHNLYNSWQIMRYDQKQRG